MKELLQAMADLKRDCPPYLESTVMRLDTALRELSGRKSEMTQDEIIRMAEEADAYADAMDIGGKNYIGLRDEYFANLVTEATKERASVIVVDHTGRKDVAELIMELK